jgi:hypothetical protein
MSLFRPYTTLAIGIALGVFVAPKVLRKVNVTLPGV